MYLILHSQRPSVLYSELVPDDFANLCESVSVYCRTYLNVLINSLRNSPQKLDKVLHPHFAISTSELVDPLENILRASPPLNRWPVLKIFGHY